MSAKIHFRKGDPCDHCGSVSGRCTRTEDALYFCRVEEASPGWYCLGPAKGDPSVFLFRQDGTSTPIPHRRTAGDPRAAFEARLFAQWDAFDTWRAGPGANLTPVADAPAAQARLERLFPRFSPETFAQLPVAFVPVTDEQLANDDEAAKRLSLAFGFGECDGLGNQIGFSFRWPTGTKRSAGARGITIPQRVRDLDPHTPDPRCGHDPFSTRTRDHFARKEQTERATLTHAFNLFVVEGASDVLAMCEMGLLSLGRPSNCGGAPELARWIADRVPHWVTVVVVGENDAKPDGRHPGLDGARRVSQQLADALPGRDVLYSMPPAGFKDTREWLEKQLLRKGHPTAAALGYELEDRLLCEAVAVEPGAPLAPPPAPSEEEVKARASLSEIMRQVAADIRASRQAPQAETHAAETIASARADACHYRCCRPRPIILGDNETGGVRVQYVRCENFERCDGCRRWRIFRERANACLRFHQAHALYEMQVCAANWERVARQFRRLGADYHRTLDGDMYYVVLDRRHPDAIATTAEIALGTVQTLLEAHDAQARPVATSRAWKLPVAAERVGRYTRIGMGCRYLTFRVLRQIAREAGCDLRVTKRPDGTSRSVVAYDLLREKWEPGDRDWLLSCLLAGEALPRLDGTTFRRKAADQGDDAIPW